MRRLIPVLALALSACSLLPAPTPMHVRVDRLPGGERARCLIVLLPGAGDRAATFEKEGFVAEIRRSGLSADIVAANATLGYYFRGTAAARIAADVIGPRRGDHERVWVLGVSMGGFGALHHAQLHGAQVDGVAVLAPYLGEPALGAEIREAGGLAQWRPDPPATVTRHNYQRQLWSWLHRVTTGAQRGPTLLVAYGDDDRLAPQDAVLAAALPADHVFHAPGGHDWPVWRALLQQMLRRSELATSCARPATP